MPEAGTLDSISFYADNVKLTGRLVFGVLRESDGAVIATSAVSTTTIGYGSPAWLTLACSGETLVSGEFYSLVRIQEDSSPRRYYDSGQTGYYEGNLGGTWPTIAPMPLTTGVTGRRLSGYITYTAAASGPVITGPAGLVDGVSDTIDGTGFDTATVDLSLAGGNTVVQAVSGQTATAITITPANVVTEPTAGVPQDAVPYTVTDVAAAGTTAYTLDVVVTNG